MKWKRGKLLANLANGAEAISGPARAHVGARRDARKPKARACYAAANLSCITEAEDAARRAALTSMPIAARTRPGGSTWQSARARRGARSRPIISTARSRCSADCTACATPVNEALQWLAAEAARTRPRPVRCRSPS